MGYSAERVYGRSYIYEDKLRCWILIMFSIYIYIHRIYFIYLQGYILPKKKLYSSPLPFPKLYFFPQVGTVFTDEGKYIFFSPLCIRFCHNSPPYWFFLSFSHFSHFFFLFLSFSLPFHIFFPNIIKNGKG